MPTSHFYSLNQLLSWLQHLHERQKKGTLNPAFEIKDYLCYEKMPSYQSLIASDQQLCFYAAKLFAVDLESVSLVKKRLVSRKDCSEINFDCAGETAVFYLKRAWEGAIKEAIGLEFNNLLTDTPIRYLCGQEVIITEKIFEPLPVDTLYELRESEDYIFAYGAWEVFTNLLRLTDRKTTNVRWNGHRLANIDFGLVFYKGKPVFDSRFTLTQKTQLYKQGQIYALKHILMSFVQHQKKLTALLLNIDVYFCRTLSCPRIPREPLRVILAALKEAEPEVLTSIVLDEQEFEQFKSVHVAFQPLLLQRQEKIAEQVVQASVLSSLPNDNGVLYAAIMDNEGFIMDEIKSAKYCAEYELPNQTDHVLKGSILNPHLLDLVVKGRNNSILKIMDDFKPTESIQIDLTQMRLLVVWNQYNIMALILLELNAPIAHIKAYLRKAIENLGNNLVY